MPWKTPSTVFDHWLITNKSASVQLLILWWQFCVSLFLWEQCKNTGIIGLLFRLHLVRHICSAPSIVQLDLHVLPSNKQQQDHVLKYFIIQLTYTRTCNHNVTRMQYFARSAYIKPNAIATMCPVQCSWTAWQRFFGAIKKTWKCSMNHLESWMGTTSQMRKKSSTSMCLSTFYTMCFTLAKHRSGVNMQLHSEFRQHHVAPFNLSS